tara:strand:+ start:519 stop:1358 length:840 start_codon:yes stop_codon:yes gene_type:complete
MANNNFAMRFETFDEMLGFLKDPNIPRWKGRCASDDAPDKWSGNVDVNGAMELAEYGWKDGRQHMSDQLDMAHASTSFERLPSHEYNVAGYMPNIPLYVSGCPSHMMSPLGDERSMGRVVEIKVNISASAHINEKTLMRRGASILSLVDKLEDSGLSCAITLIEYTKAHGNNGLIEMPLKTAGQPLDVDRCAYAMVHPSMLRKIIFALTERQLNAEEDWSGGYGVPSELPLHMRHGCVYFPSVNEMREHDMERQMARTIEIYENQTQGLDWDGTKLEDK